jgi:lysophospholipase L1-like esterase
MTESVDLFDIIITRVAIHFVNGNAFFFGIAAIIAACIAGISFTRPAYHFLHRVGLATGAIIIVMSSTPSPMWLYFVWGVPVLVVLFDWRNQSEARQWVKHAPSILLIVVSLIAAFVELPHHIKPDVSIDQAKKIILIGDSISAGVGNENDLWPAILQRELDIQVVNLSEPGFKVADAAEKAARLEKGNADYSAIILEIGGNDILGKTEIGAFEMYLDRIFSKASDCSDTIIVFELPLPPFCNRYGKIQRKLAEKYKAQLIPKRYFAGIIGRRDATVDGLHLSPIGHQMFAEMMLEMLVVSDGSRPITEKKTTRQQAES